MTENRKQELAQLLHEADELFSMNYRDSPTSFLIPSENSIETEECQIDKPNVYTISGLIPINKENAFYQTRGYRIY